jgi:hypothetical protein
MTTVFPFAITYRIKSDSTTGAFFRQIIFHLITICIPPIVPAFFTAEGFALCL